MLPMMLQGLRSIPSMIRFIKCRGLSPKFVVTPQTCIFPKKVINNEKPERSIQTVTLSNPERHPIKWSFELPADKKTGIFKISPSEGIVNPRVILYLYLKNSETINVYFDPYEPGKFKESIPLYI